MKLKEDWLILVGGGSSAAYLVAMAFGYRPEWDAITIAASVAGHVFLWSAILFHQFQLRRKDDLLDQALDIAENLVNEKLEQEWGPNWRYIVEGADPVGEID